MKKTMIVLLLILAFSTPTFAHRGRTNADGCHNNRKTGNYHCHNKKGKKSSSKSGVSSSSENGSGIVKKSKRGICHKPSSRYYKRTKKFTSYGSMKKCLKSGGRRPKK